MMFISHLLSDVISHMAMREIPSFWGQNGQNEGPHDVTDPIPNRGFGVGPVGIL